MHSRLSQLDFNHTPKPEFDARKVKGLVASLLALKHENHGKSTALEIAAGGKLYNVVVEDERIGTGLLERGWIKKRMMPAAHPGKYDPHVRRSADRSPCLLQATEDYLLNLMQKLHNAKPLALGKVGPMLSLVASATSSGY